MLLLQLQQALGKFIEYYSRRILDNGEILQRESVLKTGFSKPKVSRLLDRLVRRGLRLRDGIQFFAKKRKLELGFIFLEERELLLEKAKYWKFRKIK